MLSGGTTVSGTLFVANSVGINVFVTGGMGGVHRHGNISKRWRERKSLSLILQAFDN